MNKISISAYRKVAVTLWAVVSVVTGFTVGEMLDLSGRKMVFAVVLTVGVYVLIVIRMYRGANMKFEGSIDKHDDNSGEMYSEVSGDIAEVDVEKVQNNDKEMTNKETQEWLDKFLVNQQKGERK